MSRKNSKKQQHTKSGTRKRSPKQLAKSWTAFGSGVWVGLSLLVLASCFYWMSGQNEDRQNEDRQVKFSGEPATMNPLLAPRLQDASDASIMKLDTDQVKARQKEVRNLLDPSQDDWETEDFAEKAGAQLKRIAKLITHAHEVESIDFEGLLSRDFQCEPLRPHVTREVYHDGAIIVRRVTAEGRVSEVGRAKKEVSEEGPSLALRRSTMHEGAEGLREALVALTEGLFDSKKNDASNLRAKFKLFRVHPTAEWVETTQYFQMSGRSKNTAVARNATWHCRWTLHDKGALPRLTSIRVSDYEEVKTFGTNQTIFSDCTEGVLGKTTVYHENLRFGTDYWIQRLEKRLGTIGFGHTGLAVADVNGDDLADVYLCQPGGLPNCLLIQQHDGTVVDRAAESGVDILDYARSAVLQTSTTTEIKI